MIMFARQGKGTRKFREPKTPDFARAGAECVGWNVALSRQPEQESSSHAEELSGSLSVDERFWRNRVHDL